MTFLSRLLQRFQKTEKHKQDTIGGVPCIGEKGKPYRCKITLLDDTEIVYDVKSGSKGNVLLEQIFSHLNLLEKDYFGLRYQDHTGQTQWLDPVKSIATQLKATPPQVLWFCVKFYAADPCKLHEEVTRYQFFLQVKRDVLQGRLPVNFDLGTELAAYAVQSELGDFDPKRYSHGYVSEFRFVPNQTEEFENRVMQIHRQLIGQVPSVAEYKYVERVKWLDMYGMDLHPVHGDNNHEYYLCLTPAGVVVYRTKLTRMASYFWPRITKITYKGKMFILRIKDKNNEDITYAFGCSTKNACKHLWKCCVEHHAFFRLTSASNAYSANGKLISLGSKHRYSGRTEKQVMQDAANRPAPTVVRTPSKRHQRRNSTGTETHGAIPPAQSESYLAAPEHIKQRAHTVHKRELGYQSAPESPRSTRSAPWERKGGLFTCPDSPTSVVSAKLFPGQRPMPIESESEASTVYRTRRRGGGHQSESESEASHRHRRHRSRCPAETDGSESEASHRHRQRRSRMSNDLSAADAQWHGVRSTASATGGYPMRPNGSLNSMVSEQNAANKRARRRRSRSPSNKQPPAELAQHFKYVDPQAEGLDNQQMRDLDLQFTTVQTDTAKLASKVHKQRARSKDRRSMPDLSGGGGGGLIVEDVAEGAVAMAVVPAGEAPPPYSDSPIRNQAPPQYKHRSSSLQRTTQGGYNPQQQPPPSYTLPQPTATYQQTYQQQPQTPSASSVASSHQYSRSESSSMVQCPPVSVHMNAHTATTVRTKPTSMMTPQRASYTVPVPTPAPLPTTTVIYGSYGNSAVVSREQHQKQQKKMQEQDRKLQQQQQQQQHMQLHRSLVQQERDHYQQQQQQPQQQQQQQQQANPQLGNHARDDSGVGIESPQDSSSSPTGGVSIPPASILNDSSYLLCRSLLASSSSSTPTAAAQANNSHISYNTHGSNSHTLPNPHNHNSHHPTPQYNNHASGAAHNHITTPQSGSQQTSPTYTKPAYSEQASSRPQQQQQSNGLLVTSLPHGHPYMPPPPYNYHRTTGSERTTDL